jgi:hypothetical protein
MISLKFRKVLVFVGCLAGLRGGLMAANDTEKFEEERQVMRLSALKRAFIGVLMA